MKARIKTFYSLLMTFGSFLSFAQNSETFVVNSGFGRFILGSDKAVYGATIRFANSFTYNGITDNVYIYSPDQPYHVAGISFLDLILTFDSSNKLKQIELPKIYTKKLFLNYKNQAHSDLETLLSFVRSQGNGNGKKKKRFNSVNASGYEWSSDNALTWIYLQKSESQIKNAIDSYSITIVIKTKEP
jgi:hypothetical protein